jgi:hypothetical protein
MALFAPSRERLHCAESLHIAGPRKLKLACIQESLLYMLLDIVIAVFVSDKFESYYESLGRRTWEAFMS